MYVQCYVQICHIKKFFLLWIDQFGIISIFSCRIDGFSSRHCVAYIWIYGASWKSNLFFVACESWFHVVFKFLFEINVIYIWRYTHSFVLWLFKLSQNFKYQQVIWWYWFFIFGCKIVYIHFYIAFCGRIFQFIAAAAVLCAIIIVHFDVLKSIYCK